jgi:hypothetical protein
MTLRNSDLILLAFSSPRGLGFDLLVETRIVDCDADLTGKTVEKLSFIFAELVFASGIKP